MATVSKPSRISAEEYLALERLAETRNEYYDGQIYAMSGSSRWHSKISVNLISEMNSRLKESPCETYDCNLRVRIAATDSYVYPDLIVVCGEVLLEDQHFDTLLNPRVVFEVLSPSTEARDRGGKFAHYRQIESLTDYVLVSQDRVMVEHYERRDDQWLLTASSRLADTLRLTSIAVEVPLHEIYARVVLPVEG